MDSAAFDLLIGYLDKVDLIGTSVFTFSRLGAILILLFRSASFRMRIKLQVLKVTFWSNDQFCLQARQGRTTVISTSHVSIARIADVILVLHNGEIIEQGTPTELMMSGEAFRYLATLQVIEFKKRMFQY